jgi:hypothetical protein
MHLTGTVISKNMVDLIQGIPAKIALFKVADINRLACMGIEKRQAPLGVGFGQGCGQGLKRQKSGGESTSAQFEKLTTIETQDQSSVKSADYQHNLKGI